MPMIRKICWLFSNFRRELFALTVVKKGKTFKSFNVIYWADTAQLQKECPVSYKVLTELLDLFYRKRYIFAVFHPVQKNWLRSSFSKFKCSLCPVFLSGIKYLFNAVNVFSQKQRYLQKVQFFNILSWFLWSRVSKCWFSKCFYDH